MKDTCEHKTAQTTDVLPLEITAIMVDLHSDKK